MTGPKIDRRQLMKGSTAALVLAAAGPVVLLSGRGASAAGTTFSYGYFNGRLGEHFQVDSGGSWNSLELLEVDANDGDATLDQFTVRFRGSANTSLEEGVYDVAPPDSDVFELHIQPAGSDAGGSYYDATFSLIRPVNASCAG